MPGKNSGSNTASKREILPVVERFIESLRSRRIFVGTMQLETGRRATMERLARRSAAFMPLQRGQLFDVR